MLDGNHFDLYDKLLIILGIIHLLSLCDVRHPVHSHETRFSRNNLVIPKCHLCTGQRAFNYIGGYDM